MQLGKALLGGILGAAVGTVLLLVVYQTLGIDKFWMAIPFAIITGLGVRMLVSTAGHASYARGVLTMLLALAAYFGGLIIVAQVATARANKTPAKLPVVADATSEADATDGEAKDAAAEAPPTPPPATVQRSANTPNPRNAPTPGSPWDIIWLAIAALVAYELGRGSGMPVAPAGQPVAVPTAGSTHPDA